MPTTQKQRSAALVQIPLLVLAQLGLVLLVFGAMRAAVSHWRRSAPYLAVGLAGLGLMVIAATKTEDPVWWRIALVAGLLAVFTWSAHKALGPREGETSAQSRPLRAGPES